jgi:hypothetical protein
MTPEYDFPNHRTRIGSTAKMSNSLGLEALSFRVWDHKESQEELREQQEQSKQQLYDKQQYTVIATARRANYSIVEMLLNKHFYALGTEHTSIYPCG